MLNIIPPITYYPPWNLSLSDRLQLLSRGEKKIAYLYEAPDIGTFRYRVYNMAQVLNNTQSEVSASYFFLEDLPLIDKIADIADKLIICRVRYDRSVSHIIRLFQARGKEVYFDIDDLVFNPDLIHLLLVNLSGNRKEFNYDFWGAHTSRLSLTLKQCDAAIATNAFLGEQISNYVKIPVTVIPNFLNKEQLEISEKIFNVKINMRAVKKGIQLGYFSGSPTHNKDFALIAETLETLLTENDEVSLTLVGCIDANPLALKFKERITYFGFHDFINLQRLIGSVDFNLMPLQNNIFTNCKSELKYFEAAIVGTQSIASPTFTYANAIRHGDNGYLSFNYQWVDVLRQAIKDIESYPNMAMRSYVDAKKKYAWYNQTKIIRSALKI